MSPLSSSTTYRLRMLDTDGSESFSPAVAVAAGDRLEENLMASVIPNPGNSVFELLTSGSPLIEANIYDALGGHIQRLLPTSSQTQRLSFNLSSYPAGMYIMKVQMAAGFATVKMLKQD